MSGAVQFGQVTPDGSALKNRFSTAGLTAGVDWRATENLIVGAAVGYGTDRSDIGLRTTRSDATSMNAMLYASYKPFDLWFIDAMLGFGRLGYDTRRFVADDGATVAGARSGAYWFGAISTGYEMKYDALRLMPYVRADFMSASLDRYSEQGVSAEVLTFDAMGFRSLAGTLGLRGSYDIPVSWGVLTPTARVEYRHALDGAFQQTMYYSDLGPSVSSVLSQGTATRGAVNASLGFRARSLGGMTAELEYGTSAIAGRSQSLRGSLKLPF
jgi:outer membrane autotransporter protein